MLKIINHKMYTNNKIRILLLIISTIFLFNARQIQIPALKDYTPINVKLGLSKQIKQPNFDFSKVYKRKVQKVDTHSTYRFGPCYQNKPEVQFETLDKVIFDGIPTRPNVITNFDDIKYSQFLLDIYYQDLKIFMMFKNKKVAVITLENDDKFKDKVVFDVSGYTSEQFFETGYFIKVENYLLFVNSQYTILINDNQASVVPGYKPVDQFKSTISLQNSTFAVLDGLKGTTVYYFDGKIVKFVQNIRPPILKKPELQDIVWWKQQKKLIILDRMDGIKTLQLTFKFNPANLVAPSKNDTISRSTKKNIQIVNTQKIGPTNDCKLMYLYNTTLYVYCGTMTAYDLDKWPIIQKEALPFPNIEVKQIYQVDDIVAFVGRNVFSILYLNRMVNYYEDGNLDKLIFAKDLFISANEQGVDIGNYFIIKPYLTCYTDYQQFLGLSHLQFKTYAECNDTYFQNYGINKSMLGQIRPDDTCIYTVYKSINYWKVGYVKTIPILVAIIGIVLIIIIFAILFMVKKAKLNRVVTMIQQYSKLNNDSASAKPSHFIEQLDVDNNEKPVKDLQKLNQQEKKPSEVQLGNKNDI